MRHHGEQAKMRRVKCDWKHGVSALEQRAELQSATGNANQACSRWQWFASRHVFRTELGKVEGDFDKCVRCLKRREAKESAHERL